LLIALFAASRYFSAEEPSVVPACAAKLYSPYDPKNLEQCMGVCLACSAGVKTTCSTSCTLKGAR
jgi:ferredoxin-like protein FixX